jgi:uncharacterized membrane protein YidH (DUF202 family)
MSATTHKNEDRFKSTMLSRGLAIAAIGLICKTLLTVATNLSDYIPPNFDSDFLRGRETHFYGAYEIAFYSHICSGPFSLLAGVLLTNQSLRHRFPQFHHQLGRIQIACILLLVVPSGLWMSWYAEAGAVACVAFAALSLATGWATWMGWRQAIRRDFAAHKRWMMRSFVLLCSAVVLRIVGGLASVVGFYHPWLDPVAAWACWLVPLLGLELTSKQQRHSK